jgi:putative ABC transport system permease protein
MPDWKQLVRAHLAPLRLPPERELEIVEELALHLEAAYETVLAKGLSEEVARTQALAQITDWPLLESELARAEAPAHGLNWAQAAEPWLERKGGMRMETLWQDLRYGARMLLKQPGFSLIAVLTLALGIGANTAIFSVVNAVLLRPLPYDEADRLVFLTERNPWNEDMTLSYPDFADWRAQNHVFEYIGVHNSADYNLTGSGEPERLRAGRASADLFSALRVRAALGRLFTNEEDKPGAPSVVVLSHGLWQRRFGGDPNIISQTLTLDGRPYTVVGVLPPDFRFEERNEIWVPVEANISALALRARDVHPFLRGVARLKAGVTLEQARAELDAIAARLAQQYPDTKKNVGARITPLLENYVQGARRALWVLLGAVLFLLLIACANVANLMLARATARERELAVRVALGASRGRVVRQLLTESLLLAVVGGGLGLLLAEWGVKLILAFSANSLPRRSEIGLNTQVLVFTLTVSVLTGIVFGLAPALQASRTDVQAALKETARSTTGGRHRLRQVLIVTEVALTLVLLVGAGLLVRSFYRLQQVNPGFVDEHVLSFRVSLPVQKYAHENQWLNFYQQVIEKLRAVPGVKEVGIASRVPLDGNNNANAFRVVGQPPLPRGQMHTMQVCFVSPDYFRTLGIPLLRGRYFTEQDNRAHLSEEQLRDLERGDRLWLGRKTVVVDEEFARRHWPNQDPVGKQILWGAGGRDDSPLTVVGVVGRVKLDRPNESIGEVQGYFAFLEYPQSVMSFVVKTTLEPEGMIAAAREQVQAVDANQPIYGVKTLTQLRAASIAPQRFTLLLLGLFAAVALALAVVGIYGVMSYAVTQRTHELGIRLALGAQGRDVLRLVIGQGMKLALIGVALGVGGALALTRLLKTLLFDVSPADPVTFASIALLLSFVALPACYLPARRATKVDPLVALRAE